MLLILFADKYLRMVLRSVNSYINVVVDGNSMTPKQRMMKIMSGEPVDVMKAYKVLGKAAIVAGT